MDRSLAMSSAVWQWVVLRNIHEESRRASRRQPPVESLLEVIRGTRTQLVYELRNDHKKRLTPNVVGNEHYNLEFFDSLL